MRNLKVAEILFYLVPRKYRSIGHILVGFGGFMIILGMILYYNYLNILVHCCLIIGISGTYLRKIKYSLSDSKSEKFPYIKYLLQYGFYVITIVGMIIFSMLILQSLNSYIQFSIEFGYDINLLDFIMGLLYGLGPYLVGYPLLISGLIIYRTPIMLF